MLQASRIGAHSSVLGKQTNYQPDRPSDSATGTTTIEMETDSGTEPSQVSSGLRLFDLDMVPSASGNKVDAGTQTGDGGEGGISRRESAALSQADSALKEIVVQLPVGA